MSCSTLPDAQKAVIRAQIIQLELAYADILSGKAVRKFVDQNGEQVEYSNANASGLLAYINQLRSLVDCSFARSYKPRPIGFVFPRQ